MARADPDGTVEHMDRIEETTRGPEPGGAPALAALYDQVRGLLARTWPDASFDVEVLAGAELTVGDRAVMSGWVLDRITVTWADGPGEAAVVAAVRDRCGAVSVDPQRTVSIPVGAGLFARLALTAHYSGQPAPRTSRVAREVAGLGLPLGDLNATEAALAGLLAQQALEMDAAAGPPPAHGWRGPPPFEAVLARCGGLDGLAVAAGVELPPAPKVRRWRRR